MGVFQAFQDFFELIGITPNSKGLTQDDLKALAIATLAGATATAFDVAHQIKENSNQVLNENVEAGRQLSNKAQGTVTNAGSGITNTGSVTSGQVSGIGNSETMQTANNASENYDYYLSEIDDSTTKVELILYTNPSKTDYLKNVINDIFKG